MSNECQISKRDSETNSEWHSGHAEPVPEFDSGSSISASHLGFGFDLKFELCHLTF
jgi:hypothetical protein